MPSISKISVCIATYNMRHLILQTINHCLGQTDLHGASLEIVVYDDCSTDGTEDIMKVVQNTVQGYLRTEVKYIRGSENIGVGEGFNRAIQASTGDVVVLMCADDLIPTRYFFKDVIRIFEINDFCGHISRYYAQFIDGHKGAVRAWRGNNPYVLANNPSGLAFRRTALETSGAKCSNKMFIETTKLVHDVLKFGWGYEILPYDAIAVRVHASTSTQAGYWLKRRVSSPVLDQYELGATDIAKDFVSLIQIKRGFKLSAVIEEIGNFIKIRPINLLDPRFWFWSIVAVTIPRSWAVHLPAFYRHRIGRLLTRSIPRP